MPTFSDLQNIIFFIFLLIEFAGIKIVYTPFEIDFYNPDLSCNEIIILFILYTINRIVARIMIRCYIIILTLIIKKLIDISLKENKELIYTNKNISNEVLEEECCICYEKYKITDKIAKVKCNHYFHLDCIKKSIEIVHNPNCPYCRCCITK